MKHRAPLPKYAQKILREIRRSATFEDARFSTSGLTQTSDLPKSEEEVDDFIRRRTCLYRETWILGMIDLLLEKKDGPDSESE
jgi:hypothetical protein